MTERPCCLVGSEHPVQEVCKPQVTEETEGFYSPETHIVSCPTGLAGPEIKGETTYIRPACADHLPGLSYRHYGIRSTKGAQTGIHEPVATIVSSTQFGRRPWTCTGPGIRHLLRVKNDIKTPCSWTVTPT